MGRQCAQNIQELFEDCRRGQTHAVQLWIAQKSKKHKSPLNFLRSGNAFGGGGGGGNGVGWLAGLREPSTSHTLLHLAALHGHRELTRLLMQRDVQLATARDRKGCLPLHLAAWNGHEEIIEALLEVEPATVNAVNNARESALHLATLNGHANAARLLLRRHADARLRNARLETALDIAVRTDKANLCRLLMLNCTELNLMSASDCCASAPLSMAALKQPSPPYPLHSAARIGHTNCVEALLEHGFDPNYLGPEGTAMHVAARLGQCATLQALLNWGASIDIRDSSGQTASEWLETRLSSSTRDADEGTEQRLRECQKLLEETERRRRTQPERYGPSRRPGDIWKSAVPEQKRKQYNNGTLKNGARIPVPPPPLASGRSHSQPVSATSPPLRSMSSPLKGTFSPTSCTYQPLPDENQLKKVPTNSLPPYQNVPKTTLVYDNAPLSTGRQKKWAHNCANGCALPDNFGDKTNVADLSSCQNWHRSAKVCSPCAELGLIRLPTVEDLSPCSTLERSPQSIRGGYGVFFCDTVAAHQLPDYGGAPLAAHEELLSASATPLPTTPERSVPQHLSSDEDKSPSSDAIVSLEMPSCSSSIVTLAPDSSPSSCSLPMVSHLSPSSSASPERALTFGGEFHHCASPESDERLRSSINSPTANAQQQQTLTTQNSNCAHGTAEVPSGSSGERSFSSPPSSSARPRVRQLVHWMEETNKATLFGQVDGAGVQAVQGTEDVSEFHNGRQHQKHFPPPAVFGGLLEPRTGCHHRMHSSGDEHDPRTSSESKDIGQPGAQNVQQAEGVAAAVHALSSDRKQSMVDHAAQWKEIDELLNSLQRDSQLIAQPEEQSHSLIKNSSKNSVTSMASSSPANSSSGGGGGNGTACAYQPIVRWLRIHVGLSRDQHQQQQQLNSSAQALGELFHRHGFDTVRFMKGSLNTALMDELGVPRRVQLKICRLLNDKSVPEHIRSAEQFEFVSDWLDSLDLLDHLGPFAKANLTSTTDVIAAKLSRGDLEKMDITQLGHIARITRSLDLSAQQRKKRQRLTTTNLNASGSTSPSASGNGSVRETSSQSSSNKSGQNPSRAVTQSPVVDMGELRTRLTGGGARFSAHYLGSAEISNVEGTEDCRRAMQSAKTRVRRTADVPWVVLEVSVSGINIRDLNEKALHCHPIGNIQVVCQDEVDLNCFAYIFQEGERHFCHVFCVLTATIAKEIIVTLGETFNLAYNIALQKQ
uniref:ANK_REP_REGION domain-containing protein n=1 Tax=Globodera pallida TaxID=36090 RepID=A0A183BJI5_GLOPA